MAEKLNTYCGADGIYLRDLSDINSIEWTMPPGFDHDKLQRLFDMKHISSDEAFREGDCWTVLNIGFITAIIEEEAKKQLKLPTYLPPEIEGLPKDEQSEVDALKAENKELREQLELLKFVQQQTTENNQSDSQDQ